jgi:hypothetical protein
MKVKIIFFMLCVLSITSCLNGIGIISSELTTIKEKPKEDNLLGNWEVDEYSYEFIKNNFNSNPKEVMLILKKDKAFILKNVYDFDIEQDSIPFDISGQWELNHYKNREWRLDLNFPKNFGLASNWLLYKKEEEMVIISFIGDPDSEDRLLFKKKS